jgi:EAL domain-containing protein (putative c-di-GMP-specific phosphodiesterase class I)
MTESAATENAGELKRTMSMLRAVGVRFAIDDFGALESLGCDDLQGFLLSQPLPRDAAVAFASRATVRSRETKSGRA